MGSKCRGYSLEWVLGYVTVLIIFRNIIFDNTEIDSIANSQI